MGKAVDTNALMVRSYCGTLEVPAVSIRPSPIGPEGKYETVRDVKPGRPPGTPAAGGGSGATASAFAGAFSFLLDRGDLSAAVGLLADHTLPRERVMDGLRRAGHDLLMQQRFREGTRMLQAAVAHGFDSTETRGWLGLFARFAGFGEAAHAAFIGALETGDPAPWVCHNAAMNAHILGRLNEASEFAERALAGDPRGIAVRAARESIAAGLEAGAEVNRSSRRVVLHMNREFHYWILRPIFDALRDHYDVILTDDPVWLRAFEPEFVFLGDAQADNLRSFVPYATFIQTRHGLISKNHAFKVAQQCDFVCVSGPSQRDHYIEEGGFDPDRVWMTGYPQMDPLFRREAPPLPFPLRTDAKCVLYAPTYTPDLSSVDMLGDDMVERLIGDNDGLDLVLKPHPLIQSGFPAWYAWFERAASRPHVHLATEPEADLMPFLQRADIIVSDASSAVFQFLAVDRPIVVIDNPNRKRSPAYDPKGIEWTCRDIAVRVKDVADLAATVEQALAHPDGQSAERASARAHLFGDLTDGRSGERIRENLRRLIEDDDLRPGHRLR